MSKDIIPILKLTTGPLEYEDVMNVIMCILDYIRNKIDHSDFVKFKSELLTASVELNLVTNAKGGNKYGFAWLWVSSIALYHILCGKNSDGTISFTEQLLPDWTPPKLEFDPNNYDKNDPVVLKYFNDKGYDLNNLNWGDVSEVKDIIDELIESLKRPIVKIPQVLISLPKMELTDQQYLELCEIYKSKNRNIENLDKNYQIKVEPAFFKENKSVTLKSSNIPGWITEEILHPFFDKFNTDPRIYNHTIKFQGEKRIISRNFPVIRFSPNFSKNTESYKCAYIEYSKHPEHSNDAQSAEFMRKQLKILDSNKNVYNLIFFLWNPEESSSSNASHVPPQFSKVKD